MTNCLFCKLPSATSEAPGVDFMIRSPDGQGAICADCIISCVNQLADHRKRAIEENTRRMISRASRPADLDHAGATGAPARTFNNG